jgi:glycosyltransferase involved in cell wall biosynthesis
VTLGHCLRVLITTSTFPVHEGDGIPRFVFDLARSLVAHADVSVLAPDAPGAARRETLEGVEVHRFSYFTPRRAQRLALGEGMRENLRASWLAGAQVPTFLATQAHATRRLVRAHAIDVVNAHWIVPSGLTSSWACGGSHRIPLVLHAHAGGVYLLRRIPLGPAVARYVVARSRVVLADGSHVRDALDRLLAEPSNALLRPMGVDTSIFGRHEGSDIQDGVRTGFPEGFLLFFGRLSEKKGTVFLIRALPDVVERYPGLGLVVIGDGPERPKLEAEAKRLGVADRVRFLGRRPHADIVRYLHDCRAAVVPSIIDSRGETEGMPTVVLESMAAGVRVVGSAVDGIPDVLRHRENGWLCREQDPEDLAARIVESLEARDADAVTRNAARTARGHDWASVADDYLGYLETAVAGSVRRPLSSPHAERET